MSTLKLLTGWITTNWKILKQMGISDHFTCLLRNLDAGQKTIVKTLHGNNRLVQNWKRSTTRLYIIILLTYKQSILCKMQGWMTHKLELRWLGEITTSDMQMTPLSQQKAKRNLMRVKEKSEKAGLKLNIQKTKVMASSLITSQQIDV